MPSTSPAAPVDDDGGDAGWPGFRDGRGSRVGELVGRDHDLLVLRAALGRARAGRAQVVIVEGEPGMGKSTLLATFIHGQDGTGCASGVVGRTRWLRCDEFEQDIAFGAVALLLGNERPLCSEVEAGRRLLTLLGDVQATDRSVTVLLVDDAQWMDGPSARALRFALRRLRADRILAVIARRPGAPGAVEVLSEDPAATTVIRQRPLDAEAVRELADRLRSWDLSPDVARGLVRRTGGVPLLVSALLRGASNQDQVQTAADLPASVAAAAMRMLDAVDTPGRRLVEAAAVLAQPTDLIAVGQIAGVDDPSAALTVAVRAGLLTLSSTGGVDCAHALLREAVDRGIPHERRRELHARAARWTSGDRRLAHRTAAADRPDQQLATDLVGAAESARARLSYAAAASHRLRARTVSPEPDYRDRLLLDALLDRVDGQDLAGSGDLVDTARQLPASPRRSLALGLYARDTGDIAGARALLHEAIVLAGTGGDTEIAERAGLAAAVLHVRLGEGAEAVAVLAWTEGASDPMIRADALTMRGIGLYQTGRLGEALALYDEVSTGVLQAPWEADLLAARGMARMYAGRLPEALTDLDSSIGMAHRWRPSTNHSRAYALRSVVRYGLGDWDGAAVDAASARALAQGGSQTWSTPLAQAVSVDVPANRGQWAIAAEHLHQATVTAAALPSVQIHDVVTGHEIELALARGDDLHVTTRLDALLVPENLPRLTHARYYRRLLTAHITATVRLGRLVDAERMLIGYQDLIDRWPGAPEPTRLGWLRGLLARARDEPRAALDHFAGDLHDPHTLLVPFAHAQVLHASGALHHRMGDRPAGTDQLLRARDIFTRLRAIPLLRQCEADLATAGLQPRTVADPPALTEREADVAALVARGHTNKRVAAELFLTEKTVEYHLSKIYAKFGVSGRRQLRQLWSHDSNAAPSPPR